MDEARRVLERLDRIDELRRAAAGPRAVVDELRGLLRDGQAWLAAERSQGTDRAASALDRLGEVIARSAASDEPVAGEGVVPGARKP